MSEYKPIGKPIQIPKIPLEKEKQKESEKIIVCIAGGESCKSCQELGECCAHEDVKAFISSLK